mgnify:CR=1 FL=1
MTDQGNRPIFDISIGPLVISIHGRQHPESDDPFDRDWLLTSSSFDGGGRTAAGEASFEATELADLMIDLRKITLGEIQCLKFYPSEQLCTIAARRTKPGDFEIDLHHISGSSASFQAPAFQIEHLSAELAAVLTAYEPRRR